MSSSRKGRTARNNNNYNNNNRSYTDEDDTPNNKSVNYEALLLEIKNEIKLTRIDLSNEIQELKNNIYLLKKQVEEKDAVIETLRSHIDALDQYHRRENLEFAGLPESIKDEDLEKKVIDICHEIGVDIDQSSIVACHRLPRKKSSNIPKPVIVKFLNRKVVDKVKRSKKKLKEIKKDIGVDPKQIYINENLCHAYKNIWFMVRRLYQARRISSYWTFNGIVCFKVAEGSPITKITLVKELNEKFPNFNFDS